MLTCFQLCSGRDLSQQSDTNHIQDGGAAFGKPFWKSSHRHGQSFGNYVILNLIKLTTEINDLKFILAWMLKSHFYFTTQSTFSLSPINHNGLGAIQKFKT